MLTSADNTAPLSVPVFDRKLKICLVGYRCNPYSGGQGIYIHYLSKALVEAGHKVDVISGQPYPQLDERVNLIKLPSLNLFEPKYHHALELRPRHLLSFTDFFEWFSMLTGGFPEPYTFGRRLVQYFEREDPDYDIVHDNQSLCYGVLQLQEKGIPVVTTIHHPITSDLAIALKNTRSWRVKILIWRWHWFLNMQKKVVPQLDHLTTVSKASRRDIADAFSISTKKIKVIHNGIDTEVFKPLPEIKKKSFRIMATASADIPLKGLDYLLKAVALLVPDHPQLELMVLGKLKEDGETKKLIGKLSIEKHLHFVSGVTTQELVELYAEATLVVVPSIYEGFGLPAGEAMACGLPVISTDGGALPEVVGNSGIIVPVQNEQAIAEAIRKLLADPEKQEQLSRKARARIVELFSWQGAAQELVEFYSGLPGVREDERVAPNY
ncbi:MAG: glycosyl transferase [Gammaproteobacteria bacterium]|nr:glycosyl transferase [Gammaproteobacteria bacterium]